MKEIDGVVKRLKELYNVSNNTDLAKSLDAKKRTLDTWLYNGKIKDDVLRKVTKEKNVYLEWILSGRGPKYLVDEPMFLKGETLEALKAQIIKASACDGNDRLEKICKAFSVIDETRQDEAMKEVLSTIAKHY